MDTDTETPTPPPPEAPGDPGPRVSRDEVRDLASLRRSRTDKHVAGVAGGISRHLDIDPLLTRVVLVVLVFFGGAGLFVYAAGWLLVPLEGEERGVVRLDDRSRTIALAIVGVIAALSLVGDSLGGVGFPWPLVVLGTVVVVVLLLRGRTTDRAQASHPAPTSYPPPGAPPVASPPVSHPAAPAAPPAPRRPGPVLFWYTLALVAIGTGVLASIDLAGVDVVDSAYPALALVTSGLMLLLGAFWGRPGGLILLGLVSAVATAGTTAVGELETGRLEARPLTSATVQTDYDLDIGEIVLDLTDVADPEGLDGLEIDLEVGMGRVEVIVPDGFDVTVVSDLGAGESSVFGAGNDAGRTDDFVDGGPDALTLGLDVRVGLGDIDITREGAR